MPGPTPGENPTPGQDPGTESGEGADPGAGAGSDPELGNTGANGIGGMSVAAVGALLFGLTLLGVWRRKVKA